MRTTAIAGLVLAVACGGDKSPEKRTNADSPAEDDSTRADDPTDDDSGESDPDESDTDDGEPGDDAVTDEGASATDGQQSASGADDDAVSDADDATAEDSISSSPDPAAQGASDADDAGDQQDNAADDATTDDSNDPTPNVGDGTSTDDGASGGATDDATSDDTSSFPDADDGSSPGMSTLSVVTYSNCLQCAEDKCTQEYDACMENSTCSTLVQCLEACWNADDWNAYEGCSDDCTAAVGAGDVAAQAIGVAIGYCMEDNCDESDCLTKTVEVEEDPDEFGGPATPPEAVVEIEYEDGYLTSESWHGYVWTLTDDEGSTIEILDHEPGEPLCMIVNVALSRTESVPGEVSVTIPTYALLGINLNQERGTPAPSPGTFTFDEHTSFGVNVGLAAQTASFWPDHTELWPVGADADPSLRQCELVWTERRALSSFHPCDSSSLSERFDPSTPIESVVISFSQYTGSPRQFCIYSIDPL